ncbi:MAG: phosphoglycerate kinase [Candidatus Nitrotoga sp.]
MAKVLKKEIPVTFVPELRGHAVESARKAMKPGEIILLENLRRDPGETKNDPAFAKYLASLGDIFVQDAFGVCHREHASVVGIPRFLPSYAGTLVRDEVKTLNAALKPQHPSFAILGGAKFETKAPLIGKLLAAYDRVFITGALANDVFKAKGYPVGKSKISAEAPSQEILSNPHFLAPVDVTVQQPDGQRKVKLPEDVKDDEIIFDIGPETVRLIAPSLEAAQFILWNGPTGYYEGVYTNYTHAIAEILARRTEAGVKVVIGGGDTIAAIESSGLATHKVGFLSTGGGAMIDFMMEGTLPGIKALD